MDMNLKNKVALVCGASSGIGKAIAQELALLGAQIILLARNKEKLREAKNSLSGSVEHQIVVADLSDLNQLSPLKDKKIDILINNAGGPPGGGLLNATSEQFLLAFNQHILASHYLMQLFVPYMKQQSFGRIVNIISTSVKAPLPHLGVSNTIRGAMNNWAKTCANELAPFGITVNSVLPGATETPRAQDLISVKAKNSNISVEEELENWKKLIPMGRLAKAEEIASVVAFLASPAASYITGTAICVDGGRTPCI